MKNNEITEQECCPWKSPEIRAKNKARNINRINRLKAKIYKELICELINKK